MNKELGEQKAQLYALGILPESEREEFEAWIREDSETRALMHEYQSLMELERTTSANEPSFRTYSRIVAEIEEAPPSGPAYRTGKSIGRVSLAWGGWAAAACTALFLGWGQWGYVKPESVAGDIVLNDLENPRIVAVQTPSAEFTLEDRMLELAGLAEAYWFSREGVPSGQLLEDKESEIADVSGGFTIYDRRYNIGFIAVENLPREAPDKSFHVWAETSPGAAPLRAGTLPIGEESRGLFYFDLSNLPAGSNLDSIRFFVTEEESDAPLRPSRVVVLSDA